MFILYLLILWPTWKLNVWFVKAAIQWFPDWIDCGKKVWKERDYPALIIFPFAPSVVLVAGGFVCAVDYLVSLPVRLWLASLVAPAAL